MLILFGFMHKIETNIKVQHTNIDPICVDHYDSDALHEILDNHHKITEYTKKKDFKKLFHILMLMDDFADDPSFTRQSKMLHSVYMKLYVYRLRNTKDLDSFIDEVSAVLDKQSLLIS